MQLFMDQIGRRSWMLSVALLAGGAAATLTGCGGAAGEMPTAAVNGKVTFNGAAVTGGSITFAPITSGKEPPGKAASGTVQADGSFKLTTYLANDGAVIGKHSVRFTPPPGEAGAVAADGHAAPDKPSPFEKLVPKTTEVEVKSGPNAITVELVAEM